MSAHADIILNDDGTFQAVYGDVEAVVGDATPATLQALGQARTCRASHVEPTDDGQWTADMKPVEGPALGPFPLRSQALTAEREWLRTHRGTLAGRSIMADTHNLSKVFDKAVAFSLYIRRYANRRSVDPRLVNSDLNQEWVGVSKRLLKSDELDAINSRDRQFRNHLSTLALPSLFRSGIWLIPNELLEKVDADLEHYREERDILVDAFIKVYHSQIDKSREMLGSLFNERNYPDEDRMRACFFIRAHYIEFGAPKALNKLRADIFQREQERIEKHWSNALEGCKALLRQTLGELLDHALDRLTPSADGKTKVIRKTMLEKLDGFVSTFQARNIADDDELASAIEKIKDLADGITTADLRSDEAVRDKFKAGLASVKVEVDAMIQDAPKRAFMADEE